MDGGEKSSAMVQSPNALWRDRLPIKKLPSALQKTGKTSTRQRLSHEIQATENAKPLLSVFPGTSKEAGPEPVGSPARPRPPASKSKTASLRSVCERLRAGTEPPGGAGAPRLEEEVPPPVSGDREGRN